MEVDSDATGSMYAALERAVGAGDHAAAAPLLSQLKHRLLTLVVAETSERDLLLG